MHTLFAAKKSNLGNLLSPRLFSGAENASIPS
jgi:hypothetical protein